MSLANKTLFISGGSRGIGPASSAFLCEDVLAAEGVTDVDAYALVPGATPQTDLFVDHV